MLAVKLLIVRAARLFQIVAAVVKERNCLLFPRHHHLQCPPHSKKSSMKMNLMKKLLTEHLNRDRTTFKVQREARKILLLQEVSQKKLFHQNLQKSRENDNLPIRILRSSRARRLCWMLKVKFQT